MAPFYMDAHIYFVFFKIFWRKIQSKVWKIVKSFLSRSARVNLEVIFFFALQLLFFKKYDFCATPNMKSWIRSWSWWWMIKKKKASMPERKSSVYLLQEYYPTVTDLGFDAEGRGIKIIFCEAKVEEQTKKNYLQIDPCYNFFKFLSGFSLLNK